MTPNEQQEQEVILCEDVLPSARRMAKCKLQCFDLSSLAARVSHRTKCGSQLRLQDTKSVEALVDLHLGSPWWWCMCCTNEGRGHRCPLMSMLAFLPTKLGSLGHFLLGPASNSLHTSTSGYGIWYGICTAFNRLDSRLKAIASRLEAIAIRLCSLMLQFLQIHPQPSRFHDIDVWCLPHPSLKIESPNLRKVCHIAL